MILADTSVWIDHFRGRLHTLGAELERGEILIHPFVIGELLLSGIHRRPGAVEELRRLPAVAMPQADETAALIVNASLDGCGIGYVDAVLLASVRLHSGAWLWTLDRKLRAVADHLSIAFEG